MKFNKAISLIVAGASLAVLSACGGGGGGGGSSPSTPSSSTGSTTTTPPVAGAISGLPGSSCSFQSMPGYRVMDLDSLGYTGYIHVRVDCTHADGSKETISGLPSTAFTMTGNGVTTSAPEDMVTGTASADRAPTYLLQFYRHFASAGAVTAEPETVTVNGQDSLGRTITMSGSVGIGGVVQPSFYVGSLTGSAPAGARTIDADGKGFTGTAFYSFAWGIGSSSTCPAAFTGSSTTNEYVDSAAAVRYCTWSNQASNITLAYSTGGWETAGWTWNVGGTGPTANLVADQEYVSAVSVVPQTTSGNRVPIYKVSLYAHYPVVATPSFVSVGLSNLGWIYLNTAAGQGEIGTNRGPWNW